MSLYLLTFFFITLCIALVLLAVFSKIKIVLLPDQGINPLDGYSKFFAITQPENDGGNAGLSADLTLMSYLQITRVLDGKKSAANDALSDK